MSNYTIWKYKILVVDNFTLEIPAPAKVLHVDVQYGKPHLWVLVDPNKKPMPQTFYVRGTGHLVDTALNHLGSFMLSDGAFVGHLFGENNE